MNDDRSTDGLDALLRASLRPYDQRPARIAEVRDAARGELRAHRPGHRLRRRVEVAATLALGAAQLLWTIRILFGG